METQNSIGRLSFQLQYNGNVDGIAIQKDTDAIVKQNVLPALEKLLDRYSPEQTVIAVDKLSCEISVGAGDFNDILTAQIIAQLEKQLQEQLGSPGKIQGQERLTTQKRFAETLVFYLENGYMPWWASISSKNDFKNFIINYINTKTESNTLSILIDLLRKENVINRICNDFDTETFWAFFKLIPGYESYSSIITTLQRDLEAIVNQQGFSTNKTLISYLYKKSILKSIALYIADGRLSGIYVAEVNKQFTRLFTAQLKQELPVLAELYKVDASPLLNHINNPALKIELERMREAAEQPTGAIAAQKSVEDDIAESKQSLPKSAENTKPSEPLTENETIYIKNSGLVIIAPFLGMFFQKACIVKDDQITDTTKAITLLNYICIGENSFAEFNIALPKLLCGLEIQDAVKSHYEITETDVELVNDLLNAIMEHWAVLKNTSVDGLRGSFLMREGKLTFKNSSFYLQVQHMAFDVLLAHLPWSISMIKLPWMKHMLNVDWA